MREQLMTVQVKGHMVTGITSDGRFVRRRWRGPLPSVGALVSEPAPTRGFRLWALAATAALLVLVLQLPFLTPFAQAGTLVTVDINPSFELTVAPSGQVSGIRAANADAAPIVASLGALPPALPDALTEVLNATAAAGKLHADSDNLVLISVTPGWRGLPANIDLPALERSAAEDLDRLNVDGLVRVASTRPSDVARARLNKLSVNRYLLVRELQTRGEHVTLDEARGKSAGELLRDHGMSPDQAITGQRGGPHKKGNGNQSPSASGAGQGSDNPDSNTTSGGTSPAGTAGKGKSDTPGSASPAAGSGAQGSGDGSSQGSGGGTGNGGNSGTGGENGGGAGKDSGTKDSGAADDSHSDKDSGQGPGR